MKPIGSSITASFRSSALVEISWLSGLRRISLSRSMRVVNSYGWPPAWVSGAPSRPAIPAPRLAPKGRASSAAASSFVELVEVAGAPPPETLTELVSGVRAPASTVT
jgi:hypothetical protein